MKSIDHESVSNNRLSPMRRLPTIAVILLSLWFVSGCAGLTLLPVSGQATTEPVKVPGLDFKGSLPLRILVLHGMGEVLDNDYPFKTNGIVSGLQQQLDLVEVNQTSFAAPTVNELKRATAACDLPAGTHLEVKGYRRAGASGIDPEVVFYALNYSERLERSERELIAHDTELFGGTSWRRAWGNRVVRQSLLIGHFGDATAYLRHEGPVLRDAVRYAIDRMVGDMGPALHAENVKQTNEEKAPDRSEKLLYLISHSLGSTIAVDVLSGMTGAHCSTHNREPETDELRVTFAEQASAFQASLKAAYLLANQHGLIDLGATSGMNRDQFDDSPTIQEALGAEQIVGFSDRNDPLTIGLASNQCTGTGQCWNAVLNTTWVGVPFLFVDPLKAHTGYKEHPLVLKCIAVGCQ